MKRKQGKGRGADLGLKTKTASRASKASVKERVVNKGRVDTLTHKEVISLGSQRPTPLSVEAEKAIIQERIQGSTPASIALRYDVTESQVARIYRQFVKDVAKARSTGAAAESQLEFNNRIIRKARKAVEAGVDCNRDPYRRGTLGIKVLEGTGEFKSGAVINNNFSIVAATPAQFRDRYIGISVNSTSTDTEKKDKDGTNG